MRVSVFGLGYVGSVTAACLARAGHHVLGADTAPGKVDAVHRGASPVAEPGLEALISAQRRAGRLDATTSADEAVAASELALICVGTPGLASGQPDLGALRRVAGQIGAALRTRIGRYTVVLRSTVMPGTTERVLQPALLAEANPRLVLGVAVNPEFMREGCALDDFARPPMTLVGGDEEAASLLRALYAGVDGPFVRTTLRAAEMAKFASNAFHALKICFANELAQVAASLGADPEEVARVFLLDRKLNVSEAYLRPGFAFGGSCLPKDARALAHAARSHDVDAPLLASILPSNEAQVRRGIAAVLALGKRKVGVIGLAFKPGTDDVRESPLLEVVETLVGKGHDVRVYDRTLDPATLTGVNRRRFHENVPHIASLCRPTVEEVIAHAEVIVIGHPSAAAAQAIATARPEQTVIDLTRLAGVPPELAPAARGAALP
jgi:GDP-mannose 6-dehydrogenase